MAKYRIACLLLLDRKGSADHAALFQSLAEACGRFTPAVALRPGEAIFLEIGGSRNLLSDEGQGHSYKMLEMKLISLARRFGWRACVGYADDVGTALANARFHTPRLLPLHALHDYASPFSTRDASSKNADLFRRVDDLIQTLRRLGLESIKDFAALPPGSLASRFGKEAVELGARVRGELAVAWPGFRPSERILERTPVENSDSVESLVFSIKWLVDRATARLRGRGERASVIGLEFELARWSTLKIFKRRVKFILPLPQGSTSALIPIIQERLRREFEKEPLAAPVDAISFEVLATVPGVGAQKDLFNKKEEEAEVWASLVARLASRLGKGKVFTAEPVERHLPEKAFARVLTTASAAAESSDPRWLTAPTLPRRPLRVLQRPELLQRSGATLVHPSHGKRWNVLRWEGPERISGEWWSNAFHRDYYRVMTEQGELLWVYTSAAAHPNASAGTAGHHSSPLGVATGGDTTSETAVDGHGQAWTHGSSALKVAEPAPAFYLHGFFD